MTKIDVGAQLREWRMGHGLTIKDLEECYRICRATWNCWERGAPMSPKWMDRVHKLTKIPIETLLIMKKEPTVSLSKQAKEYDATHPTIKFEDTDTYLKTLERFK